MRRVAITTLTVAFLAGCSLVPDLNIKKPETPDKINYEYSTMDNISINVDWWKSLNDPKLNEVVTEVLKNNKDIKTATLQISLALANLGIEESALYPNVYGNANASRDSSSGQVYPYHQTILNNYSFSGNMSYEIDFWGKLRAQKNSALSLYNASIYDQKAVKITLVSSAVSMYFNIIGLQEQVEVMKKFLALYEETYNYRQKQYRLGQIREYDLEQSKAQVLNTRSQLVAMQENLKLLKNSLSVLMGKEPKDIFESEVTSDALLPLSFKMPRITSEVLLERPDVKSAIERVKSSNFTVGAAKALYFPSISLTGGVGYASNTLGDLVSKSSANFWSIGSVLYVPILDFGKIKYTVKKSQISVDLAILDYEKVVQNAFKETYDALNKIAFLKSRIDVKKQEIDSYKKIVDISRRYYALGQISVLDLLSDERNYLNKNIELISLNNDYANAYVEFYKAIGAGNFVE